MALVVSLSADKENMDEGEIMERAKSKVERRRCNCCQELEELKENIEAEQRKVTVMGTVINIRNGKRGTSSVVWH